ncbi:hypothetical protein IPO96_03475 [Candidatus Saccharibacteria bacterium]|jgi:hypothetical protein|nr:MAG: hypothetical protein IPO96_03475 [Candidatus Saccharibacteria bacterium]
MPHEAYKSPDGVPVHGLIHETGLKVITFAQVAGVALRGFAPTLKEAFSPDGLVFSRQTR